MMKVWGTASRWGEDQWLLQNGDADDPYRQIILYLGDAPIVDGETGFPLGHDVMEGEMVTAWIGDAVMMSLPPRASAEVMVVRPPKDELLQYGKIVKRVECGKQVKLTLDNGEMLMVSPSAQIMPWRTRNIVHQQDMVCGRTILAWSGRQGVKRVLLFPNHENIF